MPVIVLSMVLYVLQIRNAEKSSEFIFVTTLTFYLNHVAERTVHQQLSRQLLTTFFDKISFNIQGWLFDSILSLLYLSKMFLIWYRLFVMKSMHCFFHYTKIHFEMINLGSRKWINLSILPFNFKLNNFGKFLSFQMANLGNI